MTAERLHTLFGNRWTLPTNSCECASREVAFDLEKYGPYIDKLRALFAPSLEYRLRSLLEEFVYSADSRLAGQFPRFKKLVDTVATWKGPLNRAAEYDPVTVAEAIRNAVKCMTRDDLITCYLDSIILHRRLNKICRELDALGIDDNILRSLNVWSFVNERVCWANRTGFASSAAERSNAKPSEPMPDDDVKESVRLGRSVEQSMINNIHRDDGIGHARQPTSDYRVSDEDLLRREEGYESDCSTCGGVVGSQDDGTDEGHEFLRERSRDMHESARTPSNFGLKMIIRKMYLEDCHCATLSRPVVARLSVPCRPSDLIERICTADPSLIESCLIVMRRKFENAVYHVCSCLNDILGKLDDERSCLNTRTLRLSCEIRPGYITFKLRINGAGNVGRCLFVARIPVCQNVRRHVCRRTSSSGDLAPSTEVEERSGRCVGDDHDFNGTLECIEEESEKVGDTCCTNRNHMEEPTIGVSRGETENADEADAILLCPINENVSKRDHNLAISCCNMSSENIIEAMCDSTLCIGKFEGENEEHCETPEIDRDVGVEKCEEITFDTDNPIAKNDEVERPANDINCACSSNENIAGTRSEIEHIFSDGKIDSLSQTMAVDERDWICSSSKESKAEVEECGNACSNACSIISFVQNSERDKQLVELNCNRFSNNNIVATDRYFVKNDVPFNSTRAEAGCDSSCSCCRDDYVDITVIDSVSEKNVSHVHEASRNDIDAATARNAVYSRRMSSKDNDLLTSSVQTSRLRVSSKGIHVDISYPRAAIWLASGENRNISTIANTCDGCDERETFRASTVSRRGGTEVSRNADRESFDVVSGTRGLAESPISKEGCPASGEGFRSSSKSFSVSTEEHLRARMCTSRSCRTFATSERMNEKSRKSRKLHEKVRASSSDGTCGATTSVVTVKRRTTSRRKGSSVDARPQTAFVTDKFRGSVDRIKRLLPAKLIRVLFNNRRGATSASTTVSEFSGYIVRGKTNGRRNERDCSTTSCLSSDRCKRGSCDESSNMTVSISGNRGKERSEDGSKFRGRRLSGGSEASSSLRSVKTASWSHDSLVPTFKDLKKHESNGNGRRRCSAKAKIKYKRDARRDNRNFCDFCDCRNQSTTISSRSTEISSLTEHGSRYSERYTCKHGRETCDSGRVRERLRNGSRRGVEEAWRGCERYEDDRENYRPSPIVKHISGNSDEFSGISFETFPISWTSKARNAREASCKGPSGPRNAKRRSFLSPDRNRQIFDKDIKRASDFSDDCARNRRVLAMIADTYRDRANDLNLDFRSQLSRYVRLCKNVKRSLIRTLQPDDVYKVSATSMSCSDR